MMFSLLFLRRKNAPPANTTPKITPIAMPAFAPPLIPPPPLELLFPGGAEPLDGPPTGAETEPGVAAGAGVEAGAAGAGPEAGVAGAGPEAGVAGAGPEAGVAGAGLEAGVAGAGLEAGAAGAGLEAGVAGAGLEAGAAGAGVEAGAPGPPGGGWAAMKDGSNVTIITILTITIAINPWLCLVSGAITVIAAVESFARLVMMMEISSVPATRAPS
ncbi:unnamed protein product [Calypogeia fissa]